MLFTSRRIITKKDELDVNYRWIIQSDVYNTQKDGHMTGKTA